MSNKTIKFVCAQCVLDLTLRVYIAQNASSQTCSYCGLEDDVPIGVPIEEITELVEEGLQSEYTSPEDAGLHYDSEDGEWMGEYFESTDLLWELEPPLSEEADLIDDIASGLDYQQWARLDAYGLPDEALMSMSWEVFCEQVKNRTRFLFLLPEANPEYDDEITSPSDMLEQLGKLITTVGLVKEVPAGTVFFRGRLAKDGEEFKSVESLGPLSKEKAKKAQSLNRMSPVGIPMFYGALDEETAAMEIAQYAQNETRLFMGQFETLKPIKVVDLSNTPTVPSLFDKKHRNLRSAIMFVRSFAADVSKPLAKGDNYHVEYVPTQIVTEYFRHIFKDKDGEPVRGILYRSSRKKDGTSCVLFFDTEDCCSEDMPEVEKEEKFMCLDPDEVQQMELSKQIHVFKNSAPFFAINVK